MTGTGRDDVIVLERVPYIYYPVEYRKGSKEVSRALIDSANEINAMTPFYTKQLDLKICQTTVRDQKIDDLSLESFRMIIAGF